MIPESARRARVIMRRVVPVCAVVPCLAIVAALSMMATRGFRTTDVVTVARPHPQSLLGTSPSAKKPQGPPGVSDLSQQEELLARQYMKPDAERRLVSRAVVKFMTYGDILSTLERGGFESEHPTFFPQGYSSSTPVFVVAVSGEILPPQTRTPFAWEILVLDAHTERPVRELASNATGLWPAFFDGLPNTL